MELKLSHVVHNKGDLLKRLKHYYNSKRTNICPCFMWFSSPSLLTCCSMGLGCDPRGLWGRKSSSAGPLVSSCSNRRDFVPEGCSHWRTVSRFSNTQLQMASDEKLRRFLGKILNDKWMNIEHHISTTTIKALVLTTFPKRYVFAPSTVTLLTKEELNLLWRKTVSSSVSEMASATCLLVTTPKRTTPRKSAP